MEALRKSVPRPGAKPAKRVGGASRTEPPPLLSAPPQAAHDVHQGDGSLTAIARSFAKKHARKSARLDLY